MAKLDVLFLIGLLAKAGAAQFNLYPPIDPTSLAKAFNVTAEWIQALNQTLPECDPTLFQMVGSFDNYWWEDDNVTSLCLGNCTWATTLWDLNVSGACDGEYISAYGKLIPADSISGRMLDSIKIACLGSNTDDAWCLQSRRIGYSFGSVVFGGWNGC
ncbi:hypothetical protein CJF30_00010068 [Rutstroemia sp. NJR-2017a BBW]|nr:hypothetical protein CJF30_00010068 [Rutstroemia sp. NJR-2017a BBW]